jgi:transposase InsO family protein
VRVGQGEREEREGVREHGERVDLLRRRRRVRCGEREVVLAAAEWLIRDVSYFFKIKNQ